MKKDFMNNIQDNIVKKEVEIKENITNESQLKFTISRKIDDKTNKKPLPI